MDITYLGHSSFKLRGRGVTVITDPYADDIGLKFPKHQTADIVTISHGHSDHNAQRNIEGTPYVVSGPGEYEVAGVSIVGIPTFHDSEKGNKRGKNTMYRIEIDGISIVHLGDLGHVLSSEEIEELDGVDVLLIPVGGTFTINAEEASTIVNEVGPAIVIPMHYNRDGLNQKTFGNLLPVNAFLKEMGKEGITPQPKFSVTHEKLPEEMQVVVLE